MRNFFTLIIISLLLNNAWAQEQCTLEGRITNEAGEAIPYCSIYLPELKTGSMANIDGEFSLKLPCGSYTVKVQSLGYEAKSIKANITEGSKELELSLRNVSYALKEVTIDPNSEDPAYNIIRKATVMAEFYKKQISAYKALLYVRSFYDIKDIPWIAEKLADEESLREMKTGNISETLLEYTYEYPNTVKEKILAKKTGDNDTLRSSSNYINLNFYQLGGNEIINPLSKHAFQVYKFEYIHTEFQGKQKVHKIKVLPRRRGSDLMKGYIYINDGIWNINNVDVDFEQPMADIKYQQQYQEVEPLVWMPVNHKINVQVAIAGFKVKINYLATLREVDVSTRPEVDEEIRQNIDLRVSDAPEVDSIPAQQKTERSMSKTEAKINELISKEKLSNRETVKLVRLIEKQEKEHKQNDTVPLEVNYKHEIEYADSALSANDSLWNAARQIPLSEEETKIYEKRDSLNKIVSGDTVVNQDRSLVGDILFFNGSILSKNKRWHYRPKGLIAGLRGSFNTVDGLLVGKELFSIEWRNPKAKFARITPVLEYAEARESFMGQLNFEAQYNGKRRAGFSASAGRRSSDYNRTEAMHSLVNAFSSLFFEENYKKFYLEDYASLEHHFDIANGLSLSTGLEYSDRNPLKNNSDFAFIDRKKKEYSTNLPENEYVLKTPSILEANKAFSVNATISYTPKYYYRMQGNNKQMLSSRYPTFKLNYRQGISDVLESTADYQLLSFSMNQSKSIGLINEVSYHLRAGKFLSSSTLPFADYQNFNAHPFWLFGTSPNTRFNLLDPYRFNTNDYFLEGHLSIEDNHLLLKYLPLLNRTNYSEAFHFNYLYTEQEVHYYELGYTLNKIFLFMNAGVFVSFEDDEYQNTGFRVYLDF